MTTKPQQLMEQMAAKYVGECLEELFAMKMKTGVGWGSDEAIALIIEDVYKNAGQARDKVLLEAAAELQMQVSCLQDPFNMPQLLRDFKNLSESDKQKIHNLIDSLKALKEGGEDESM